MLFLISALIQQMVVYSRSCGQLSELHRKFEDQNIINYKEWVLVSIPCP